MILQIDAGKQSPCHWKNDHQLRLGKPDEDPTGNMLPFLWLLPCVCAHNESSKGNLGSGTHWWVFQEHAVTVRCFTVLPFLAVRKQDLRIGNESKQR